MAKMLRPGRGQMCYPKNNAPVLKKQCKLEIALGLGARPSIVHGRCDQEVYNIDNRARIINLGL